MALFNDLGLSGLEHDCVLSPFFNTADSLSITITVIVLSQEQEVIIGIDVT